MATTTVRATNRVNHAITETLRYGICILIALIILVPIAMAVLGGLKGTPQLLNRPFSVPDPFVWSNYSDVLRSEAFWRQCGNSLLVLICTTLMVLSLSSCAAFAFARFNFRRREVVFTYFTLGLLFPETIAILPLYLLIRQLGLVDTLWGIILPQVAFGLPFAVLTMVTSWNKFFLPLVVLNTDSKWTLPLGVMQYQGQFGTDWARVLAFVSLALTPAVVFYLFCERQIIAGLTAGAVKG